VTHHNHRRSSKTAFWKIQMIGQAFENGLLCISLESLSELIKHKLVMCETFLCMLDGPVCVCVHIYRTIWHPLSCLEFPAYGWRAS